MKNVRIITVDEAIKEGNYKIPRQKNDVKYDGFKQDYLCGFCMEGVTENGKIGYSELIVTDEILAETNFSKMVDFFDYLGITPTGRLVFRGYFKKPVVNTVTGEAICEPVC